MVHETARNPTTRAGSTDSGGPPVNGFYWNSCDEGKEDKNLANTPVCASNKVQLFFCWVMDAVDEVVKIVFSLQIRSQTFKLRLLGYHTLLFHGRGLLSSRYEKKS